ncbi:MAG: hypothetical protein ACI93R_002947 [Flavobacteriales bacterium]
MRKSIFLFVLGAATILGVQLVYIKYFSDNDDLTENYDQLLLKNKILNDKIMELSSIFESRIDARSEENRRLSSLVISSANTINNDELRRVDCADILSKTQEKPSLEEQILKRHKGKDERLKEIKKADPEFKIEQVLHDKFDTEEIDYDWATEYENQIYDLLATDNNLSQFGVDELVCKSSICRISLNSTGKYSNLEFSTRLIVAAMSSGLEYNGSYSENSESSVIYLARESGGLDWLKILEGQKTNAD